MLIDLRQGIVVIVQTASAMTCANAVVERDSSNVWKSLSSVHHSISTEREYTQEKQVDTEKMTDENSP